MANEFAHNVQDADLTKSAALPAAAGSVALTALDLGAGDAFLADCELEITTEACDDTAAPDTSTLKINVEDSADNTTFATLAAELASLTAAASAGFAAQTLRFRIPSNAGRYIRAKAITAASVSDCSGSDLAMKLLT